MRLRLLVHAQVRQTSFLKLRPIEPFSQGLSKSVDLCESYESCHQNSHLMSDMPWLCEINRSHCPVMMSSVSLIAVCRFGAQAKRKSLKWCSAASARERQVGKAAAWAILLADQTLTYSTRVVVVDGHGFFVLDGDEMAQAFADIVNALWKSYLPTPKQWSDTKLLGQPAWQEYEGVTDLARLCPFKPSAFISCENEEVMMRGW